MLSVLAAQAAVEYIALVMTGAARTAEAAAFRTMQFISTPRGVLIACLGVILLALSLGRRRSL